MYAPRNSPALPADVLAEFQYLSAKVRAWVAVDHNEDGTHNLRPSGFDFVPIGAIQMWGSDTAPDRWLICDGRAVSRTTYQALFAIIGTAYGAGDGLTTFNIPELRQRFAMGKAASGTGATLGSTGGAIDHTHSFSGGTTGANGGFSTSTGSGGGHTHTVSGTTSNDTTTPQQRDVNLDGSFSSTPCEPHVHDFSGTTSSDGSHTHSISVGDHTHSLGSGATAAANPPYLVVNYIVLTGVE